MDLHRRIDHELEGERDDDQVDILCASGKTTGSIHRNLGDVKPADSPLRELMEGNEAAQHDEKV